MHGEVFIASITPNLLKEMPKERGWQDPHFILICFLIIVIKASSLLIDDHLGK